MQILTLIYLSIILIGFLILLFILFPKEILRTFNRTSEIYRWFFTQNSGFFKVLFILIFFLEQVAFIIILDMFFNITKKATTFIGIFALIVITTATLQAFIWEQKFRYSEEKLRRTVQDTNSFIDEQEGTIDYLVARDQNLRKTLKNANSFISEQAKIIDDSLDKLKKRTK